MTRIASAVLPQPARPCSRTSAGCGWYALCSSWSTVFLHAVYTPVLTFICPAKSIINKMGIDLGCSGFGTRFAGTQHFRYLVTKHIAHRNVWRHFEKPETLRYHNVG